jgi:DNA-binding PadR family transcriptional regulator
MATIDLIVLGMLKDQALSAYDIQKLVEYRNISGWVRISTPSIYKKVLQLKEKGYVSGTTVRDGKMPEKEMYSLTDAGEAEFERLMLAIAAQPVHFFLDFNAVIVNIDKVTPEKRALCLNGIRQGVQTLKSYLEKNLDTKGKAADIPQAGMAVLRQQYLLAQAIEAWLDSVEKAV